MSKRTKEREQFLADIIVGAVEGGCSYWARSVAYRWSDEAPATTRVLLIDMEQEEEFYGEVNALEAELGRKVKLAEADALTGASLVTIDTVAKGLGKIKRNEVKLNSTLKKEILLGDSENDGGYIDADGADVIVQAAIFGEVVYG